jgi:hypothetical protein
MYGDEVARGNMFGKCSDTEDEYTKSLRKSRKKEPFKLSQCYIYGLTPLMMKELETSKSKKF